MIAWMPDGKQLQVVRSQPNRTSQIGTVTIQDGTFQSIKSLEWRTPSLLSLSPDGRYLAYDVPAGEADLRATSSCSRPTGARKRRR